MESSSRTMMTASNSLRLHELLNITDEDLDYYLNYTVLLTHSVGGTLIIPTDTADEDFTDSGLVVADDYAGCGLGLHKIRRSVHLVHGFLSLIICVAGCLANVVNILVLSRRELRRTAINRILCSLAVADFLLMLEYIPFACHMYLFPGRSLENFYSYSWAVFVLFHAHFTLVAHTVSIWLTLSLAFWRYEVLKNGRHHQRRKSGRRCHQERCTRTILLAYVGSIMLCIPSFVLFGIEQQRVIVNGAVGSINQTLYGSFLNGTESDPTVDSNITLLYKVNLNPIAKNYDGLIHKAHLWAYSVVMKLGPCLVLTVLTCWLVRRLWEAERHHQSLSSRLAGQQLQPQTDLGGETAARAAALHHDNQVSLTQQLEMRQLNSAMNRSEAGASISAQQHQQHQQQIPIIVTEPALPPAAPEPVREEAVEGPSIGRSTTISSILPANSQQNRRRISVLECSSYVGERTEGKMDTMVAEDGHTVMADNSQSATARSQMAALNSTKSIRHKHQTDRTTRMLVAVLLLFLITEIPQGIMALLSGILGRQFFTRCYSTGMGEILDLLALLNSAINFLLYCSMSRAFRRAARTQFRNIGQSITSLGEYCCGRREPDEDIIDGGGENNNSTVHCFNFRLKLHSQQRIPAANISPSNPTRCTQL